MINNYIITTENESLQKIVISKNEQVEELQSILEIERDQTEQLKVQMEEFKKIEELRISSSHDSEFVKYQRDAAVQFSYMIPERKLYFSFTINGTSKHILSF